MYASLLLNILLLSDSRMFLQSTTFHLRYQTLKYFFNEVARMLIKPGGYKISCHTEYRMAG